MINIRPKIIQVIYLFSYVLGALIYLLYSSIASFVCYIVDFNPNNPSFPDYNTPKYSLKCSFFEVYTTSI